MYIALYNLELKYKNLALEKIRIYHQQRGDFVEDYLPVADHTYDKIYCSSIFDDDIREILRYPARPKMDERWICGGTGYDLTTTLPPEIDEIKPRLNFGFTTRGCIRKCPFCVVPEKEGTVHAVGDIYDLWDGKAKEVTLFDNNILALPDHFFKICDQLRREKLKVDFNQGLDIRLLADDMARELSEIRHHEYRFAFDYPELWRVIFEKVELLKSYGINRSMFYVLVGYNTTITQDLRRLKMLKSLGQKAYVMRYKRDKVYIPIAEWANQPQIFQSMTFEQFLEYPEKRKYKELFGL